MGFTDRPLLPGQYPLPEPPGNDLIREIMLRSIMQKSINPYGMSPEGASGINGPLFSTGLNPAPAFGMTSRGDMGDPNFRQSFLGGPQYPTGGGPGSVGGAMGQMTGGFGRGSASSGARVPINAMRQSLPASGGSGSSLLQMLLSLLGNSGSNPGGQSFYDGRRVSRGRFYDARRLPDPRERGGRDRFREIGRDTDLPRGGGRGTPILPDGGPHTTQTVDRPGGSQGGPAGLDFSGGKSPRFHGWASVTPWAGQWQVDERGFPIGPGGVRYIGSMHEFSGGGGGTPAAQRFRSQARAGEQAGGPSYAQWLQAVNRAQVGQANQRFEAQGGRAAAEDRLRAMLDDPNSPMTSQARAWYAQHPPTFTQTQPPPQPPPQGGGGQWGGQPPTNTGAPY